MEHFVNINDSPINLSQHKNSGIKSNLVTLAYVTKKANYYSSFFFFLIF